MPKGIVRLNRLSLLAAASLTCLAGAASAREVAQMMERAPQALTSSFDIYIPLQNHAALEKLEVAQHTPGNALYHKWLTPKEFEARFAPDAATIDSIRKELRQKGLEITETHTHSIRVSGTVSAIEHAFSTQLSRARFASGKEVLAAGRAMTMTPKLAAVHAVVPEFSGVIHMQSFAHRSANDKPLNRYGGAGPYWFTDLKQAYQWPSYKLLTGKGVTIGILMEAGYSKADTDAYFAHEKLATPKITEININGAPPYDKKNPFNSAETQLDIQQSGGMAPDAHIIHYNIADLYDATILGALTTIIQGSSTVDGNVADVVSMSFGGPELFYTRAYNGGVDYTGFLTIYDDMFAQGNVQGISFVASSGDGGAKPLPAVACFDAKAKPNCGKWQFSVESPASSPHVTGVGGTNLTTTEPTSKTDLNSAYVSESAYGDPLASDIFYGTPAKGAEWGSGGGKSIVYPEPSFQALVDTGSTTRAVPDVSLHMGGCPQGAKTPCPAVDSSVAVGIDGSFYGFIGTSASAPDFAGLTALKIQRLGTRLGNQNFEIYALAAAQAAGGGLKVFRPAIPGNNGYGTRPGYDFVLGNGTLRATSFLLAPMMAKAGIPQTPSNP
ncbi:MAG TPA: S53 family peptidase [Alphaproteobacteria bacterium]|nr:S53 family peptidase [Alphaproteobacteria bacterium]